MKKIEGLSVLVTGGGSGIGAATAKYFVEQGALVTICGQREEKIQKVASDLGAQCLGLVANVRIAADRERCIEQALAHGGKLDVLINNAANMLRGAITELNEAELLDIFAVERVGAEITQREGSNSLELTFDHISTHFIIVLINI